MLSFFPPTVVTFLLRTIFAFFLCSVKHPSDFQATTTKEFGRSQWAKMLSSNLMEKTNKDMDEDICKLKSLTFEAYVWLCIVQNFHLRSR